MRAFQAKSPWTASSLQLSIILDNWKGAGWYLTLDTIFSFLPQNITMFPIWVLTKYKLDGCLLTSWFRHALENRRIKKATEFRKRTLSCSPRMGWTPRYSRAVCSVRQHNYQISIPMTVGSGAVVTGASSPEGHLKDEDRIWVAVKSSVVGGRNAIENKLNRNELGWGDKEQHRVSSLVEVQHEVKGKFRESCTFFKRWSGEICICDVIFYTELYISL